MKITYIVATLVICALGCGPLEDETGGQIDGGLNDRGRVDGNSNQSMDFAASMMDSAIVDSQFNDDAPVCNAIKVAAQPIKLASDIIFVVDNSGSMHEENGYVQDNINKFTQGLAAAGLDFRLVLITNATLVETGWFRIVAPEPLRSDAAHFLAVDQLINSHDALYKILETGNRWHSFLRPGAFKHLVVASDDDSALGSGEFLTSLRQQTPFQGAQLRFHAIVADQKPMPPCCANISCDPEDINYPKNQNCCQLNNGCVPAPDNICWNNADGIGGQYIALRNQTGGIFSSMCQSDWGPVFENLKTAVIEGANLPCSFSIPDNPTGQVDYDLVNMQFVPSQGAAQTIARVSSAAVCNDRVSWYYNDPVNPTQLIACPKACEQFKNSAGKVNVAFGCRSEIIM